MGIKYSTIDNYLLNSEADEKSLLIMKKAHAQSEHKRKTPINYGAK